MDDRAYAELVHARARRGRAIESLEHAELMCRRRRVALDGVNADLKEIERRTHG